MSTTATTSLKKKQPKEEEGFQSDASLRVAATSVLNGIQGRGVGIPIRPDNLSLRIASAHKTIQESNERSKVDAETYRKTQEKTAKGNQQLTEKLTTPISSSRKDGRSLVISEEAIVTGAHWASEAATAVHIAQQHLPAPVKIGIFGLQVAAVTMKDPTVSKVENVVCSIGSGAVKETVDVYNAVQFSGIVPAVATRNPFAIAATATRAVACYATSSQLTKPLAAKIEKTCHEAFANLRKPEDPSSQNLSE